MPALTEIDILILFKLGTMVAVAALVSLAGSLKSYHFLPIFLAYLVVFHRNMVSTGFLSAPTFNSSATFCNQVMKTA